MKLERECSKSRGCIKLSQLFKDGLVGGVVGGILGGIAGANNKTKLNNACEKMGVSPNDPVPQEVNGYKLYVGDIKTNELSINFDSLVSK